MLRNFLKKAPETPGIYIFWSKKTPIYIGKAVNIKKRLESYFRLKLAPKTRMMVSEADKLTFIKVTSELEALLLESKLIRSKQPKYNFIAKDDKHPLYIKITSEPFPRIITVRKNDGGGARAFFGPFPSSRKIYSVLKMIRKIIPFSDHKPGKRPCLYSHIGLCNPCPNTIRDDNSKKVYLNNIRTIKQILSGRIKYVIKALKKDMNRHSKNQEYEKAQILKEKIEDLNYITQKSFPETSFLENPNLTKDLRHIEIAELKKILSSEFKLNVKNPVRIECFDVSHLSGTFTAASMVTFIRGEPEKSLYRRFRIRQTKSGSDTDSLTEVAKRRINNFEKWGRPDLIIIDGGKGQVASFSEIYNQHTIPVVGIEKQFETLVFGHNKYRLKEGPAKNLVVRLRDESHRFAQKYHNLLIHKDLFKLKRR